MKKRKVAFILLFLSVIGIADVQAQQANTAAGGDASGSGGTASYSVGQVAYTSVSGTNGSSNQGVQQPYEFYTIGLNEVEGIRLECSVYPNPVIAEVILKIDITDLKDLSFQLYDVGMKLLMTEKITGSETSVPMATLSNAVYFLRVLNSNTEIKSFKIIKTN